MTEYPPQFYDQVFELLVETFFISPFDKEMFINTYCNFTYTNISDMAYAIYFNGDVFSFCVPDDEYPALQGNHISRIPELAIETNKKIKEIADRYIALKSFL